MKIPEPENFTNMLLKRAGITAPPTDLNQVAALWSGLNISEESLEKAGYFVDLGKQGGEIIVKADDAPASKGLYYCP